MLALLCGCGAEGASRENLALQAEIAAARADFTDALAQQAAAAKAAGATPEAKKRLEDAAISNRLEDEALCAAESAAKAGQWGEAAEKMRTAMVWQFMRKF